MSLLQKMREDWNRRAKEDANFYVAFAGKQQSGEDFLASGAEVIGRLQQEFFRLPAAAVSERKALEIGCGPGRLMIPMSRYFGEIHGVDISPEMAGLARERLASVPHAHVHVNSGAELGIFEEAYFDFVYSWIVFQHIPSKELVFDYLRDAQRVLKPGGVMACQLRGVSPIPDELRPGYESTWTGCWFSQDEIVDFALAHRFRLVAISGFGTQYAVAVFQKRIKPAAEETHTAGVVLKDVTAAKNSEHRVPTRGCDAAVSLWLDGFPPEGDLAEFPVLFGGRQQTGCFLSPIAEGGGCQLNATLPENIQPGVAPVRLSYRGTPITGDRMIDVFPAPPRNPKVVRITDRINPLAYNKAENQGLKVTIEDLEDTASVSFAVGRRQATGTLVMDCEDPITSTYIFGFPLPQGTSRGRNQLTVRIGSRALGPFPIEIA